MAMAAAAQSSSSSFSFITASPSRQTTSSSSNTTLAPICSRLGKVSQLSISKFGQYSYTSSVRALQVKAACWISQNQRKKHKQRATLLQVIKAKTAIQFIEGRDEQTVPEVKLTKSKDGNNGVATFTFVEPSVFDETSQQVGDITGLYLIDDEGVIRSVDVTAKFVNGRPSRIEARHVMRSPAEWDRFMRFMERYATDNGLQFIKK